MNLKRSGIYQIRNLFNGKIYIGSSNNIRNRWYQHKNELKKGIHHSSHLQHAWNKYGEDNFIFEVIEFVEDVEELLSKEQFWLDRKKSYDGNLGYNICLIAGSSSGVKRSEDVKRRMSGENNGSAKLTENDVRIIKLLSRDSDYSLKMLSAIFDITSTVFTIQKNKNWKFITIEENDSLTHKDNIVINEKISRYKNLLSKEEIYEIFLLLNYSMYSHEEIANLFDINERLVCLIKYFHKEKQNVELIKNKYTINNELVSICIGEVNFIMDKVKFDSIKYLNLQWYYNGNNVVGKYPNKSEEYKDLELNRIILKRSVNSNIKYLNNDRLDNRMKNLVTVNSKVSKNNSSGAKGVRFRKDRNKWQAYVNVNKKFKSLGHFETFEEAKTKVESLN